MSRFDKDWEAKDLHCPSCRCEEPAETDLETMDEGDFCFVWGVSDHGRAFLQRMKAAGYKEFIFPPGGRVATTHEALRDRAEHLVVDYD